MADLYSKLKIVYLSGELWKCPHCLHENSPDDFDCWGGCDETGGQEVVWCPDCGEECKVSDG